MKRNISNVKQSAQQDRSTFVKTIQKRFLDNSILPWYNKFNQTPCKTVPISQSCRVSFRCTFPFPTRNLHSTVPSFFEFLFATNGPPRSLRDPYRPLCPFEDVCSCSYINSALMVEPFCSFKVY